MLVSSKPVWVVVLISLLLPGCALFSGKKSTGSGAADQAIRSGVTALLAKEPALGSARLDVTSSNGIVELTGDVDSAEAKSRAGLVAASVAGVKQVRNDVLVRAAKVP